MCYTKYEVKPHKLLLNWPIIAIVNAESFIEFRQLFQFLISALTSTDFILDLLPEIVFGDSHRLSIGVLQFPMVSLF